MNAPFIPPGSGHPEDPAGPDTPVARTPEDVRALAGSAPTLGELVARQSVCRACPRLVAWREQVAVERRRAFAQEEYWGRPVPGWGDAEPRVLIVGLAPAAHGGNRTGRIFTGDRSGDWLFASLYRTGLAAIPTSTHAGDGQRLLGTRVVAPVRCAPPANKPTPDERAACLPWLVRELGFVAGTVRSIVVLGGYGWQALWPALKEAGYALPAPRPAFGHGAEVLLTAPDGAETLLLGCYHPSQQNTFTGRVTEPMLDAVFTRAREYAHLPGEAGEG
ncbi:uracil-DNA glycosylase [Actinoallomurus soli]|uniref:uracil-DNA glycosylase n=1 Tax=Actinoallomurus soli TaxID=2952535 RepID=UPI0020931538|nr:uracil-DNA glycosylase [Actinoallomurus soli]MCO5972196.1 uracil-DNA glycosylase [Actinoallomurus soli]